MAARVLKNADEAIDEGCVVVEDHRIAWVGPAKDAPAAEATIDLGDATLTPGLVNAHSHLDLSHLKNRVPFRGEFADWIEGVVGARREPGIEKAAATAIREAQARGTTCFGDIVGTKTFGAVTTALTP